MEYLKSEDRTNYVYRFTYNSGPGLREVFQCKYVKPDEALTRFQRILSLTEEPFDFKIVVIDESKREESSFEVEGGSVNEMIDKFRVFLEASTGILFVTEQEDVEVQFEEISFESMSSFEKMHIVIYASFKHGKFSSLDVAEIFEAHAHEELILKEALGFAEKGKGAFLNSEINGDLPINPSGGALGGNPPCGTGLIRIIEATKQITGESNGYQVEVVNKALATGQIGMCAQNNIVYVLEGGN